MTGKKKKVVICFSLHLVTFLRTYQSTMAAEHPLLKNTIPINHMVKLTLEEEKIQRK